MLMRWDVINSLIKIKNLEVGAEIGVKEGRFISFLLKNNPNLVMYSVDPRVKQLGGNETYFDWDFKKINKEYKNNIIGVENRIIEYRHFSVCAARLIADQSLDFVFIDAQHNYDSVKNDLEYWTRKVKKGGLVSGHDYEPNFPGVVQAVQERFTEFETASNAVWYKWI